MNSFDQAGGRVSQTFLENPNYISSKPFSKTKSMINLKFDPYQYRDKKRPYQSKSLLSTKEISLKPFLKPQKIIETKPNQANSTNIATILTFKNQDAQNLPENPLYQNICSSINSNKKKNFLYLPQAQKKDKKHRPYLIRNFNLTNFIRQNNFKYKCMFCHGKRFPTSNDLEEHMQRRHLIHNSTKVELNERGHCRHLSQQNFNSNLSEAKPNFSELLTSKMESDLMYLKGKVELIEKGLTNSKANYSQINNAQKEKEAELILGNSYNSKMVKEVISKIKSSVENNNKEYLRQYNDLKVEMEKVKLAVSNEISSIKQAYSFQRALQTFNANATDKQKFVFPGRRNKKHNSVKNSSSLKRMLGSEQQVPHSKFEKKLTSDTDHLLQQPPTADTSGVLRKENLYKKRSKKEKDRENKDDFVITKEIEENITSSKKSMQKEFSESSSNTSSSACHQYINFNSSEKESSFLSQTKDEIELQNFYKKFIERDKNYNGHLSDYFQELIPPFTSKREIEEKIKKSENERVCEITLDKSRTMKEIEKYSKEELINFIRKVYGNFGDKSTISDFYGYYSKNLDFLFDIKGIIDSASQDYFENKLNQKDRDNNRKNSLMSFGKLFDNVNYNICSSAFFSFKEEESEESFR